MKPSTIRSRLQAICGRTNLLKAALAWTADHPAPSSQHILVLALYERDGGDAMGIRWVRDLRLATKIIHIAGAGAIILQPEESRRPK